MNRIEFKYGHRLYKTGDADAPASIKDSHGEVVLDLCRNCNRGEVELVGACPNQPAVTNGQPPVSDDGIGARVRLKWYTPQGDAMVAHMARVSNSKATPDMASAKLIGYLMKNRHWSPFEMASMCVEIHTERDISAQLCRHRSFSFQEFSTRYSEVENLRNSTECRFQDHGNRQNSHEADDLEDETINGFRVDETQIYMDFVVRKTRETALETYRNLLERGVAKECARRLLPIGLMPTVMYINGNLRSWITYIMERTKPGVQKEHREIALAVEPVFASCFPQVWAAVLAMRAEQDAQTLKIEQLDQIVSMLNLAGGEAVSHDPVGCVSHLIHLATLGATVSGEGDGPPILFLKE